MADRHENNWQPVRPLDDDVQEVEPVARTAPTSDATATTAEPEAQAAVKREPFRSTPITMPPESIDNPPLAPPDATPEPSAEPVVGPETDRGTVSVRSAASAESATATSAGTPKSSPATTSARAEQRPEASTPEARPIPSPPVPPAPQPVTTNQWVPQHHWAPHDQGLPPGQTQPGQWQPQNQWAPQPGQWPQPMPDQRSHPNQGPPHQTLPHPGAPIQQAPEYRPHLQQGPGDALIVAPTPGSGWPGQQPVPQATSSLDLGSSLLIRPAEVPPVAGWRRALHLMSAGHINVGNSATQQRRLELTAQVRRPLVGCYRVAVLSLKGGVGKTTTTATLGSTFAQIRGDRVIAIDANPDRGTLGQKVPSETTATVRNLLRDIKSLDRYSDVRAYTSQNAHRLEVLASDSDPAASEAFSGEDYDRAVALLEKFYSIVITDCGTGLMHSAMESILEGADTLVVVSSGSVDGARSASATLDWLDAHGYRELVAKSVAVVNGVRPRAGKVDLQKVVEHFEQRCARVRTIPFDPHLEEGAEIELDRLRGRTRKALLEVAAAVATGFPDASTGSYRN